MHFVVSKDSTLANRQNIKIEELIQYPFLLTEKGMSYRRILDEELAKRSIEIKPVLEMSSADLLCNFVGENAGVSFLPDYVTDAAVKRGEVVRLNVQGFDIKIWKQLIHHKDKWVSKPMQIVINELSKVKVSD